MATNVAAALAAELGLRTAADLRPAVEPRPEAGRLETVEQPFARPATIAPAKAILPVTPDISALLPHGGLATVTAITASRHGATSLLWRLLAGPTRAGAWCALVGMPRIYPLAATAAGVDLDRVALVDPGTLVAEAAGTLAEGIAALVLPSEGLAPTQMRRLTARARRSGTAIVWWETRIVAGADARLDVSRARWKGLRANTGRRWGAGRLDACELEVASRWRSGGTRRARIWPYGGDLDDAGGNVVDLRSRPAGEREVRRGDRTGAMVEPVSLAELREATARRGDPR
ncbi:hypothetical protein [Glycomyces sp. NRRL B-16210]|uniref:hypothetical protein n=1 Tax=Glycomyces sp. NRRL B-16210 TaxID=1463821 RepID=UPI00069236ED|nr:hypothetical protein [Glycomyces sp. NRRL B-16210]